MNSMARNEEYKTVQAADGNFCPTCSQKTVRLLDFLASGRLVPAFSSLPALAI